MKQIYNGNSTDRDGVFDGLCRKFVDYPCQYCGTKDKINCGAWDCPRWKEWAVKAWSEIREAAGVK